MGTSQKADNLIRPQFVVPLKCFRIHSQNVGQFTIKLPNYKYILTQFLIVIYNVVIFSL